jgi:hypothetical protein
MYPGFFWSKTLSRSDSESKEKTELAKIGGTFGLETPSRTLSPEWIASIPACLSFICYPLSFIYISQSEYYSPYFEIDIPL